MRNAIILLLANLLVTTTSLGAGRIKGRVLDRETNEPLIGANVIVVGTSYGSTTGADGSYMIFEIPAGVYKLTARYVGYTHDRRKSAGVQ